MNTVVYYCISSNHEGMHAAHLEWGRASQLILSEDEHLKLSALLTARGACRPEEGEGPEGRMNSVDGPYSCCSFVSVLTGPRLPVSWF